MITYLCWVWNLSMLVKWPPRWMHFLKTIFHNFRPISLALRQSSPTNSEVTVLDAREMGIFLIYSKCKRELWLGKCLGYTAKSCMMNLATVTLVNWITTFQNHFLGFIYIYRYKKPNFLIIFSNSHSCTNYCVLLYSAAEVLALFIQGIGIVTICAYFLTNVLIDVLSIQTLFMNLY